MVQQRVSEKINTLKLCWISEEKKHTKSRVYQEALADNLG